jgi:hypothetical protein
VNGFRQAEAARTGSVGPICRRVNGFRDFPVSQLPSRGNPGCHPRNNADRVAKANITDNSNAPHYARPVQVLCSTWQLSLPWNFFTEVKAYQRRSDFWPLRLSASSVFLPDSLASCARLLVFDLSCGSLFSDLSSSFLQLYA